MLLLPLLLLQHPPSHAHFRGKKLRITKAVRVSIIELNDCFSRVLALGQNERFIRLIFLDWTGLSSSSKVSGYVLSCSANHGLLL